MSRDQYDYIFSSALALRRYTAEDYEENLPVRGWMGSVAELMFVVINEWEKEDRKIPDSLMDAAERTAKAWEDMMVDAEIKTLEETQG